MEISPDGRPPAAKLTSRFTNLPELQQMFQTFSDVQTAEMLNLPRPAWKPASQSSLPVPCQRSNDPPAETVERYEHPLAVDPREDNALATDGRKLATDARMLSATAPRFPASKVNRLVENVVSTWNKTAATHAARK